LMQSLNVLEMEDDESTSAHSFGLVDTVVPAASSDPKELRKATTDQIFEDFLEQSNKPKMPQIRRQDSELSYEFDKQSEIKKEALNKFQQLEADFDGLCLGSGMSNVPSMPENFRLKMSQLANRVTLREKIAPLISRRARTFDGFYTDGFSEEISEETLSESSASVRSGMQKVELNELLDVFYGTHMVIRNEARIEKMNYEKTIPSQRMPSLSDSSVSDGGSLVHLTTLRMGRRAQDALGLDNSDIPELMEEFDQSMMRMLDPALQSDAGSVRSLTMERSGSKGSVKSLTMERSGSNGSAKSLTMERSVSKQSNEPKMVRRFSERSEDSAAYENASEEIEYALPPYEIRVAPATPAQKNTVRFVEESSQKI